MLEEEEEGDQYDGLGNLPSLAMPEVEEGDPDDWLSKLPDDIYRSISSSDSIPQTLQEPPSSPHGGSRFLPCSPKFI
jgi:hypothetical protein